MPNGVGRLASPAAHNSTAQYQNAHSTIVCIPPQANIGATSDHARNTALATVNCQKG